MLPFGVPVVLICGPPGSGKTTWVRERMQPGDLVIDLDRLFQAISGLDFANVTRAEWLRDKPGVLLPYALALRDAALNTLLHGGPLRQAWVIMGGPKRSDRYPLVSRGAQPVILEVAAAECLRRIANDTARSDAWQTWQPLVLHWWEQYEPELVRESAQ